MLLALTIFHERVWLLLIGSLGQLSPTLTCSLTGLLTRTLPTKIGLLEQTELSQTGLLERTLPPTIGLLVWKIIVLTCSLKLTLLPQMG